MKSIDKSTPDKKVCWKFKEFVQFSHLLPFSVQPPRWGEMSVVDKIKILEDRPWLL